MIIILSTRHLDGSLIVLEQTAEILKLARGAILQLLRLGLQNACVRGGELTRVLIEEVLKRKIKGILVEIYGSS